MKTGQFAAKYNLTPNGIRYYIEQGLLTPKKKGHQYDFDSECITRMDEILQLKQMHYSLGEISRIFHTKGLIQHTLNPTARSKYNRLFTSKIHELEQTIAELQDCIGILNDSLLPKEETGSNYIAGLPITCMSLLTCPCCGRDLDYTDTKIRSNKIVSGKAVCSCGYSLDISDGIITNAAAENRSMNIEWSNLLNLLSEYSTDYLNLEANSYYQLKTNLTERILENDTDKITGTIISSGGYAGDFLCKYHHLFAPDSTFIFVDQSIDVIRYIQDKLGLLNDRFSIIYICDDSFDLPLKENTIDMFLDDYSSSEFIFYNPEYPIEKIRGLLKEHAVCAGVFTYYAHSAKTLTTIKKEYDHTNIPLFYLDTFKRHLRSSGVDVKSEKNIGNTKQPGTGAAFDYHHEGDALHFYVYFGLLKKHI